MLALVAALLPAGLSAQTNDEILEIRSSSSVAIKNDRAYLLFRTFHPKGSITTDPVFLRLPTPAEMARPDQLTKMKNLQKVDSGRAFEKRGLENTYLIEAQPGQYVLYGASAGVALIVCNCLGTVGFDAQAGIVTDLGYILSDRADRRSFIPELSPETGFGPGVNGAAFLIAQTIRPPTAAMPIPDALKSLTIQPARYHAAGPFIEPRALLINRMVPIPGILAYEGGMVVDVSSGTSPPPLAD
ncbi:MAG: hypothetical protein AB7G25_11245 [Sphingomonadaceae bacterium]